MKPPMDASAETTLSSSLFPEAAPSPSSVRFARRVTTGCVWPANYRNPCQQAVLLGRTCLQHMTLVRRHAGTLHCAWPGCTWRAWDHKGLCSFHRKVAFGLIDF
jgi:hypothetical protein